MLAHQSRRILELLDQLEAAVVKGHHVPVGLAFPPAFLFVLFKILFETLKTIVALVLFLVRVFYQIFP